MSDTRTLREKLEAMAAQDSSPHEAAIAQAKLADMGSGHREPPRVRLSAPSGGTPGDPWPGFRVVRHVGYTTSTSSGSWTITGIRLGTAP